MTSAGSPALRAAARERDFPADGAALGRLARYVEAVVEKSRHVNLTGAKTPEEALDALVIPSLAVARAWPEGTAPGLVVDLGSGNGFPGVAAAVAWPSSRVLLVERRAKKARAIASCLVAAGIENAQSVACDGRELLRERPDVKRAVDLVTARAMGLLAETLAMAAAWLAPGGRIVQWKAFDVDEDERREGDRVAGRSSLVALPDVAFAPGPPGPGRLVIHARPGGRG